MCLCRRRCEGVVGRISRYGGCLKGGKRSVLRGIISMRSQYGSVVEDSLGRNETTEDGMVGIEGGV